MARVLSDFEKQQLKAIQKWKQEEPGVVSKAFGVAIGPLAWMTNKIVPQAAIKGCLDFSSAVGGWLADTDDILRDAGVPNIEALRSKDSELSDKLANDVHNWAIGIGTAEGGATGFFGIFGAPVDIP